METPIDPQNLKEGEKYKIVVYKPMPTPGNPLHNSFDYAT